MDETVPVRALTKKQLEILDLLYRFRFATNQLLATSLNVKYAHKINERLKPLLEKQYIGRNFSPDYHLHGKPAIYFLMPNGIKAIRATVKEEYSSQVLHNAYKDKMAKDRFINRCLDVFEVYTKLAKVYGEKLEYFAKSELYHYEDFPDPRPDAYFRIDKGQEEGQYFLEIMDPTQPDFALKRRIKQYIEYAEGGDWEDATGTPLPAILLICGINYALRLCRSPDRPIWSRALDNV